ncbi:CoA-binding protein, partial [Candidatus Bathyarchaeota archaeon]|nr:CoA-binding protein [Candidatus Bathyarchaeota archaeon]NIW34858.1 CoA-binding protein [Candidatus Bathyarchaeota archaeon]
DTLEKYKTIAVVGMSRDETKPAHYVPAYFSEKGYDIIPINPKAKEILGARCYKSINEVDEEIEILNVFRPSEKAAEVVKSAIERRKARGDVNVIWLQEGITSKEARKLAEEAEIEYFEDRCMYKEYVRILPDRE